jgi:hypothetical protein
LIPERNVTFGGSGGQRRITIAPSLDQHGRATLTFTVRDGFTDEETVSVVVLSANSSPTIAPIADQVTTKGTPTGAIPFMIGDVDSAR